MSDDRALQAELDRLLAQLCDRTVAALDLQRIEQLVLSGKAQRERYVIHMQIHALSERRRPHTVSDLAGQLPTQVPVASRARWLSARGSIVLGFLNSSVHAVPGGSFTVGLLLFVAVLAAFWGVLALVNRAPGGDGAARLAVAVPGRDARREVATLTHTVACVWADPTTAASARYVPGQAPSGPLRAGTRLALMSGVAELQFDYGANVAVEGPCLLTLDSAGRSTLDRGKLWAQVPRCAEGFTVVTPHAEVVDLGTEFGVEVDRQGGANIFVVKGLVQVNRQAEGPGTAGARQTVRAGEAVRVAADRGVIEAGDVATRAALFPQLSQQTLRHRPTSQLAVVTALDLVDLISGGDGTGHNRGTSIALASGRFGRLEPVDVVVGDGLYHPIPNHAIVEGCFVPNGLMTIDSASHTFAFPETDGTSWGHICAGCDVPWKAGAKPSSVGGVDYTQDGHARLMMHANKAVTFDLDAVRRMHRGRQLTGFQSTVGNAFGNPAAPAKADVFLIVDGKARFERRGFTVSDGGIPMSAALTASDRFLTLAITDGGDGFSLDLTLFGDPKLILSRQ